MDLKYLEQLIKLCRKTGVTQVSVEGVSLTLTPEAPSSPYKRRKRKEALTPFEQAIAQATDVTTKAKLKFMSDQTPPASQSLDSPSELDMLLWSSGQGDGAN